MREPNLLTGAVDVAFNNTKGRLLLATICRASSNTVGIFLPMANTVSSEKMMKRAKQTARLKIAKSM